MRTIIVPDITKTDKILFDPYRFLDLSQIKIKLETSGNLCNFAYALPEISDNYFWEVMQDELGGKHLVAIRKDGHGLDDY